MEERAKCCRCALSEWLYKRRICPLHTRLEAQRLLVRCWGVDVVTFSGGNAPECSPLSCNSLAKHLSTNEHCLFTTAEEAAMHFENGAFKNSEPGPYRTYAVYSVKWP